MFCSNCGVKFDGHYCPECGTPASSNPTNEHDIIPVKHSDGNNNQGIPIIQQPTYQTINQIIMPMAPSKKTGINLAKTIIGILCMVCFVFIFFQSCAVGCVNVFNENVDDTSAGIGFFVALLYLVIGIISTAGRSSRGASLAVSIVSALAAIIGFSTSGTYVDLVVWSGLSVIIFVLYLIFFILQKKVKA